MRLWQSIQAKSNKALIRFQAMNHKVIYKENDYCTDFSHKPDTRHRSPSLRSILFISCKHNICLFNSTNNFSGVCIFFGRPRFVSRSNSATFVGCEWVLLKWTTNGVLINRLCVFDGETDMHTCGNLYCLHNCQLVSAILVI